MDKHFGFGDYEQPTAMMHTRRGRLLAKGKVVPWYSLPDLIDPHYPKTTSKCGRPPCPPVTTLRIHPLQHSYGLSDRAMEDELIECRQCAISQGST